jgi:hypothetical protein
LRKSTVDKLLINRSDTNGLAYPLKYSEAVFAEHGFEENRVSVQKNLLREKEVVNIVNYTLYLAVSGGQDRLCSEERRIELSVTTVQPSQLGSLQRN